MSNPYKLSSTLKNTHEELIRTILRGLGSKQSFTRDDLVARSGLHRNTLARFLNDGNLSVTTLIDLAVAVDELEYEAEPTHYINEAIERRRART